MELLFKLMDALGPSGFEHEVRNIIRKEIKPYVDECYADKFGNLIARRKGKGQKIMLAAHMDEIGLMAQQVKENGRIFFVALGGIEPLTLIGEQVHIIGDKGIIRGIITIEDIHADLELKKLPDMKDLYVDTGLSKSQLHALGVYMGAFIVPYNDAIYLGSKEIISGKACDDRIGCYSLIELAKRLHKQKHMKDDIYYVFTVQEEVGLYGAGTSVYKVDPDWGIAVETTSCEDFDELYPKRTLGGGPTLILKDAELISHKPLNDYIRKIAKDNKIPLQLRVEEAGTTDATKITMNKGGIPSTVLSVAVRNLHSTVSIASIHDIENQIKILEHLLKNPPSTSIISGYQ